MKNLFTRKQAYVRCRNVKEKQHVLEKYFPEVKKNGGDMFGATTPKAYAEEFNKHGDRFLTLVFSHQGIYQTNSDIRYDAIDAQSLLSMNTLKGIYDEC